MRLIRGLWILIRAVILVVFVLGVILAEFAFLVQYFDKTRTVGEVFNSYGSLMETFASIDNSLLVGWAVNSMTVIVVFLLVIVDRVIIWSERILDALVRKLGLEIPVTGHESKPWPLWKQGVLYTFIGVFSFVTLAIILS